MAGEVDLHIHSNRSSDGDFSPFHIIQLTKETKLRAISIADHDTVAAYPEALELGKEAGVEVIPSIELTTIFDNREFHLLLPFVNWKRKIVSEITTSIAKKRVEEAKDRVRKLQEIGFNISWKEVAKRTKSKPPFTSKYGGSQIIRFILLSGITFIISKASPQMISFLSSSQWFVSWRYFISS